MDTENFQYIQNVVVSYKLCACIDVRLRAQIESFGYVWYVNYTDHDVKGQDFRKLDDRDLKDLIPSFTMRKAVRMWVQSWVCMFLYVTI